jgi:hypothetical protein
MVLDGKICGAVHFAMGYVDSAIRPQKIGKSKVGEVAAYPAGVQGFDHYP